LLSPKFRATVEVKGRLGLIYQRLDGINLFDLYKSASSNPAKIEKLGKLLADVHISLHKNKVPNFPPLKNYLKKIATSPVLSNRMKKHSLEVLRALPDDNALCHLDFRLRNVILTAKGPYTIDWSFARKGNPHADVEMTSMYLNKSFFGKKPLYMAYIERYKEKSNVSQEEIDEWKLPLAAAGTKLWGKKTRNQFLKETKILMPHE
jgi:Ser/Thr protein kinase RdoA (MazF antagonist)